MIKNLYFDYCALFILGFMLVTLILKKGYRGRTNRSFSLLLLSILYATLYDVCAVLLDNHGFGSVGFKYVMHSGYLAIRNFIPIAYICYVISLTDTWHLIHRTKLLYFFSYFPYLFALFFIVTAPFNKLVYYIDDNTTTYTRGPFFFLLYFVAAFYLVYGLVYAIKYYNQITLQKFVPLIIICPMQILSIVIQFLRPEILIEMFFSSISILLIMLTIQRPESMFDQITGLLKTSVYTNVERLACLNKKDVKFFLINITNYKTISSFYSYEKMSSITSRFGHQLVDIAGMLDLENAEIYYLGNGRYSIVLDGIDIKRAPEVYEALTNNLNNEFVDEDLNITLNTNIIEVNVPDDFSVYEELVAFEKDAAKLKYKEGLIHASDLLKNKDYRVVANMDSILEKAIEDRAFEVYYQPIYSIAEDRFNSCEALIRLKTEKYGFIRPDLFIPIAEESGLINQIDDIVFEEVCKFISSDAFMTLNVDYIEVNLSVVQCMDPHLSDKILYTMEKYGVMPSQINLEITETATEYSQAIIDRNIEKLEQAGLSFSLDDFGTGYSNMSRIASLPLHIVKIDKSLAYTNGNKELMTLLRNSVDMINKMNYKIVVEGVETEEMLDLFKALECDYIQGYYFSKPLPKDEFVNFITSSGKNMSTF